MTHVLLDSSPVRSTFNRCKDKNLQLPITTGVVSSNLDQGEVYNIMWKICQWLATGQWFSPSLPVSSTNKTDCHDRTEILLKVALNTIKQCFLVECDCSETGPGGCPC